MIKLSKQLIIPLCIAVFLVIATVLVVLYAKGYRLGFDKGQPSFGVTGQLVLKSVPDGASVYINGHLTTATNNTIDLTPGDYEVKIAKEGYFPWQKSLNIQKEIVTSINAILFPNAPLTLSAITQFGALNPVIDPTQTKIAYVIASQSAQVNGIYVLDITSRPLLNLQSGSTQLVDDTQGNFS